MTQKKNEDRKNEFNPDYATSPGETLQDTIDALGMSQADLAIRAGKHKKTINEVIKGKAPITPETALQLEKILGVPASFWNNRQVRYAEFVAREEEYSNLQQQIGFLEKFPIREMVKYGWLPKVKDKVEQLQNLLSFFGVASPQALDGYLSSTLEPSYRISSSFDTYALAAWLKQGEIVSQSIQCATYSKSAFQSLLSELRILSLKEPSEFMPELQQKCASVGVVVVYVRELPETKVCGAARWLKAGIPLIQLSLRFKKDDQFWFTFFHEAKHILQNRLSIIILDDQVNFTELNEEGEEDFEADANRFASRTLIPISALNNFNFLGTPSEDAILEFAEELGIAPGIVVGQLQHRGRIPWNSRLNSLKKTLEFPD